MPTLKAPDKEKDETKFFRAFHAELGVGFLVSKSLKKGVKSQEVFFTNNYKDFFFDEHINSLFKQLLTELNSNFSFSSKSLAHHLDGLVVNHPVLGARIVEFDEEQHFTPALHAALKIQAAQINNAFNTTYVNILTDVDYLNTSVLKKHRIRHKVKELPKSFQEFQQWLVKSKEKTSGYIEAKQNGFPYLGGRIAQRAYYDSLRNSAHLSSKNPSLKPPLRFPKKYFEDIEKVKFNAIEEDRVGALICHYLEEVYKIVL